jgi:hypothetical protein
MSSGGTGASPDPFEKLRKNWELIAVLITGLAYVVVKLLGLGIPAEEMAIVAGLSFLLLWGIWRFLSVPPVAKVLLSILGIVIVILLIICLSTPHFEITTYGMALKRDTKVYEVTNFLIDADDAALAQSGITSTLTIQISPWIYGGRNRGRVVAILSGKDPQVSEEKLLWKDFSGGSTAEIHLSLPELCRISGIEKNAPLPADPFHPSDLAYAEAKLTIRVAPKSNLKRTWAKHEITVRNAPWDQRSALVWRNDRYEADIYVKNLGSSGRFGIPYNLVRLEGEVDANSHPMWSGTKQVTYGHIPDQLVSLGTNEFMTHTLILPAQFVPGRYLLEVYPVKELDYVQPLDPNVSFYDLGPIWLFSKTGMQHIYVVPAPEVDAATLPEWNRLRVAGIDLGQAQAPLEEVISPSGTQGHRQVFKNGEIYVQDNQAYSLYGAILEHYWKLGGIENERLGFPLTPIQSVTSSLGIEGVMMEFEGPGEPHSPTVIYASGDRAAAVWEWTRFVYSNEQDGHSGWLGFPLADAQQYGDKNTIQAFEHGYIIYHFGHDWLRAPVAYPYLGDRGILFDVHADQSWQGTGIHVKAGDRVTSLQVGGEWTHHNYGELYGAEGTPLVPRGDRGGANLPDALIGTLLARVGDDGTPLALGRWATYVWDTEGFLYLVMNDNRRDDNNGQITVEITIDRAE